MNQTFVLPGESAEKNGGVVALELGEGPLYGLVEVLNFALLDAGFLGDTIRNKQIMPSDATHSGGYVGLGIKF